MDTDKKNPDKQGYYDQFPGTDIDVEGAGSQPIDKEDPELAVQGWLPLAKVLEAIGKLFPPRR